MTVLRIGIVDSGVNPWHSHVRGRLTGCRIFVDGSGRIVEDDDYRDHLGHGTAVAGVIREAFPDTEIFAVRVFDAEEHTYPSLVARGILRAAAEGCQYVNVSISLPPDCNSDVLAGACAAVLDAGAVLVASARPDHPGWLPASLPGVYSVTADDTLQAGDIRDDGNLRLRAPGVPRELDGLPRDANLWGSSFACARGLVHVLRSRRVTVPQCAADGVS